MLVSLAIRDLAVIEDATLELGPGLNCLTGETGAGKSIIIDALGLVLGGRAETELIRFGREKAEVTALFRLKPDGPVKARLADSELLDPEDPATLLIRRVVAPQGKGRVWVNGQLVNVSTLASLTRGLIDISSQHQHTALLDPASHLETLDRFGGLERERVAYNTAVDAWKAAERHLHQQRRRADERAQREAFVRFSLEEIDAVAPKPGEDDALEAEYQRLAHADRLVQGASEVVRGLAEGQGSALERLTHGLRALDRLRGLDPAVQALAERLESARIELDDIAHDLRDYSRRVESDPSRLDSIASRLETLKKLKRKHGHTMEALIAAEVALRAEVEGFESLDIEIAEAERAESARRAAAQTAAEALSKARATVKAGLEVDVARELTSLAMRGAKIRFELEPREVPGPEGLEDGEIVIETNAGEGYGPLAKVASGGELSRVLLALKRVLMHVDPVETCIFDEVDAGTGGAVGDMIGLKLAEIADEAQVLCITHLPQIAARGLTHLRVEKRTQGERTATRVERLTGESRVAEVARMLGGLDITERTRAHAQELLAKTGAAA